MELSVDITAAGYLHLPAELARRHFPANSAVALLREPELWLLPTRGAGAGGLLLKQRNRAGDRSVLIWEALPPGAAPGPRRAVWDERGHALRIALAPSDEFRAVTGGPPDEEPIGVTTLIGQERGRWVVYLEVAFRDGVRRHRVGDYPTERGARVAADHIRRGAERERPFRSEGW